jgi:hypothetical protein
LTQQEADALHTRFSVVKRLDLARKETKYLKEEMELLEINGEKDVDALKVKIFKNCCLSWILHIRRKGEGETRAGTCHQSGIVRQHCIIAELQIEKSDASVTVTKTYFEATVISPHGFSGPDSSPFTTCTNVTTAIVTTDDYRQHHCRSPVYRYHCRQCCHYHSY